jgi:crotonobetainyl-CoA:carnitine CoA-transferase CaiB-like acyl-CoA transferase
MAYNTSKRGITLNLDKPQGRELFLELVKRADFLIESFPPGHLQALGLDWAQLSQVNPGLIMASITPFGRTGPWSQYRACDLIAMALGGVMFLTGDETRPPVRLACDQSYVLAGAHAAVGCLLALHHRHASGQGQHIDVSIQECVAKAVYSSPTLWEFGGQIEHRQGGRAFYGSVYMREVWKCQDGYIIRLPFGGIWGAADWQGLVGWMEEEGLAGPLKDVDWEQMDVTKLEQGQVDRWEEHMARFFLSHTTEELETGAARRGMRLVAVKTVPEVLSSAHLRARGFWQDVHHPHLGRSLAYPGFFYLCSHGRHGPRGPAPRVGEHNQEVYVRELGLSPAQMEGLKQEGVI